MVLKGGINPSAADIRFGEQATRTYTYNPDGTIATMTIASTSPVSSSTFTYAYDSSGRIITVTATGDFTRTETITYNADDSVASIVIA